MILRRRHHSPIDRQLEAFGEPWQHGGDAGKDSRDGEDLIAVALNLFLVLREREEAWRDEVFRGEVAFSPEDDLDHRERYTRWLEASERILSGIGQSAGTVQLRSCIVEAKRVLEDWQSPRLSSAVGLRDMTLSAESAAELDQLLSEAKTSPTALPQRRMATQDSTFLNASTRTISASDE
jgi:hypothetical protein